MGAQASGGRCFQGAVSLVGSGLAWMSYIQEASVWTRWERGHPKVNGLRGRLSLDMSLEAMRRDEQF